MAVDYGLTTEARVKAKLGITVSSHDTVLKRMIYSVTDYMQKQTGRTFKQATYTNELYNGQTPTGARQHVIVLKNAPVSTVSSFEYKSGTNSNPTWTAFSVDDYDTELTRGIIYPKGSLAKGIGNLRATYTAGYLIDFDNEFNEDSHTLPYDLTEVCERAVTRLYKKRESEGKEAETFDTSSINWVEGIFDEWDNQVLRNYRRVGIGV